MKVWIFNHYAQPDSRPGGTRHFDLGRALTAQGHEVTIFAAGFHYTLLKEQYEYDADGIHIEMIEGVRFVWVKTFPYERNNWRRMFNILSFGWRVFRHASRQSIPPPDIIIGSTVHPFAALAASGLAKRHKVPFVFEIRDLWPETFIDMGLWQSEGWQSRLFYAIEARTVATASGFVVLSPLTIAYLEQRYGINRSQILLLPNGVAAGFLREPDRHRSETFSVTYVGGIDRVHGLDFLIDIAGHLVNNREIRFDVYGDGKERTHLIERCQQEGITNVIWHGSIPKSEVPDRLASADALFVSTSNVQYGSENKLYEYMASAVPLVAAVSAAHNNPVEHIGCGISVDRSDAQGAAAAILTLSTHSPKILEEIGRRGRAYVERERMIPQLAERLAGFLKKSLQTCSSDESRL